MMARRRQDVVKRQKEVAILRGEQQQIGERFSEPCLIPRDFDLDQMQFSHVGPPRV